MTYDGRPPPAAVEQSGERSMSAAPNPPSVTAVSAVPGNEQNQQLGNWETGRIMPAQSTMPSAFAELEPAPSAAATYAPYQTYDTEQRSGNMPPYAAVSQMEDWKQHVAAYRQTGNSDMQRYTVTPTEYRYEYHDNRPNVGGNVAVNDPATAAGLEVSIAPPVRGASNSALRQPATTPGMNKKTVTFHENIATEYAFHRSYGSTSSESSFIPLSPPEMSPGYDSVMFPAPISSYGAPVPR